MVTPESGSDKMVENGTRQIGHESSALMSFSVRTGRLSIIGSMRSIIVNGASKLIEPLKFVC